MEDEEDDIFCDLYSLIYDPNHNVQSIRCEAVPDEGDVIDINRVQQTQPGKARVERTGPDPRVLFETPNT